MGAGVVLSLLHSQFLPSSQVTVKCTLPKGLELFPKGFGVFKLLVASTQRIAELEKCIIIRLTLNKPAPDEIYDEEVEFIGQIENLVFDSLKLPFTSTGSVQV